MLGIKLLCEIEKWSFTIFSNSTSLIKQIVESLGMFDHTRITALEIKISNNTVYIDQSNSIYTINCFYSHQDLQYNKFHDLLYYLLWRIETYTDNMLSTYTTLHGGLIGNRENAIGIIAPTKTGKSTLVTYLCINGFDYMSDDYIFIDNHTETFDYPTPIILRNIDMFNTYINSYLIDAGYNLIREENNYIIGKFKKKSINNKRKKIKAFLFLVQNGTNNLVKLTKGESYKKLIHNLKTSENLSNNMKYCLQLTHNIDCYEVSYVDFDYIKTIITELLESN